MPWIKLLGAAVLASALTASPALARHRQHHHHHHYHHHHHHLSLGATIGMVYSHNYGPPVLPGETFAYYDGPLSAMCRQSAAAYRGQDGRRHPCN